MRLTFVTMPDFDNSAAALTDEDIRRFQRDLHDNPETGDRVTGTDFRKLRIRPTGRGKRGGDD